MSRGGRCVIKIKASVALLAVVAAILVVALACGDNGEEPSPSPTVAGTPTPTSSPSSGFPFQFEGPIGIDLTTFGVFFEPGRPIQLGITVAVQEPMTLYYLTAQRYDLAVVDSEGQEVWRWSRDRAFAQVTEEESLEAGDMLSFDEKWDQRDNDGQQVPVGTYQIVAESSHCDANYENCGQLTTSATIQIRPSEEAP
jgi:hypothetical protein